MENTQTKNADRGICDWCLEIKELTYIGDTYRVCENCIDFCMETLDVKTMDEF
jgi:hypothetical protein